MGNIFDLFRKIAKEENPAAKQPVTWLVVGLGNPGEKYARTRHNAGFLALEYLAQKANIRVDKLKFHALVGDGAIGNCRVLLMKPQTMMNLSGNAVGEAAAFYKIAPDHVLVLSDEIALAPGKLRLRAKGSAGGHNGLKDIIAHLGSEDFPRLRIGVGERKNPEDDLADWVLSDIPKSDWDALFSAFGCAARGVELILDGRFDEAVNLCNSHTGGSV